MSFYQDGLDVLGLDANSVLQYIPWVGPLFKQDTPAPPGSSPAEVAKAAAEARASDQRAAEVRAALERLAETQRMAEERRREEQRKAEEKQRADAAKAEERAMFWRAIVVGGALIGTGVVAWKILAPHPKASAPAALPAAGG